MDNMKRKERNKLIASAIAQNYKGSKQERNIYYLAAFSAICTVFCGLFTILTNVNELWILAGSVFLVFTGVLLAVGVKNKAYKAFVITAIISSFIVVFFNSSMSIYGGYFTFYGSNFELQIKPGIMAILSYVIAAAIIAAVVLLVINRNKKSCPLYKRLPSVMIIPIFFGCVLDAFTSIFLGTISRVSLIMFGFWLLAETIMHIANSFTVSKYENYEVYNKRARIMKFSRISTIVIFILQALILCSSIVVAVFAMIKF